MKRKDTKEYAGKLAFEKYPSNSASELNQRSAFYYGYLSAIEETAAPELLDALQFVLEFLPTRGYREAKDKAKKAIKKATSNQKIKQNESNF